MNEHEKAIETLERARKELVREIASCGESGGIGRSQSYASALVTVSNAISIIKELEAPVPAVPTPAERMAAVRAARNK